MLSVVVFLPSAAAAVLLALPRLPDRAVIGAWVAAAAVDLALVIALWVAYPGGSGVTGDIAYEADLRWIPTVGSGYHIGVDGLSLPLVAMTALLFFACAVYSLREQRRVRAYAVLFLFLQTVSLGLFVSLDLILFFVFFDLSIVGMYFVIAGWGHGTPIRSALQFFLYTFVGSLALLLGFIGLYLAADPHTFDMVELARSTPLEGDALAGGLVLAAIAVGLAVKTPTVPFHTWLPPAHTDAPAPGSAILAGVLLKMGAYGFVRIAMPILPGVWRDYAAVFVVVGVVSVLYGALVALAQTDFKRMVAYTSVNHMGYIVLGLGAAGMAAGADLQASTLAVTGAVTQMVAHGLLTGSLFLLAGVLYTRGGTYDMAAYGGLAKAAPRFALVTAVAAFGSLGLPGLAGFIAEFQIFTGSLSSAPVPTALAFFGILLTAALLLRALQRIFLGQRGRAVRGEPADLSAAEALSTAPPVLLAIVIGIAPRFLLDVIEPAARTVAALVAQ
ncbi:complex I subunit 4 family protein [Streptomonospora salina]|uniref:NADH-quinone oxidoreductase subunit M n=1 Tax=Streptomonospora salina TaxID=104205 RepID=A0A841EFH4_9ACTN|nr:NADH-quinone oxidoreductase subunit M [Streptomonospora salina]MBB5998161.1 NADH-quinone oxidoreductase subunit M [Streptomonospora salina]